MLSFPEFVRIIAAPGSNELNVHWRPQHRFCGLDKFVHAFNHVGNFEALAKHGRALLDQTATWDAFGKSGWGKDKTKALFVDNTASHGTRALGTRTGTGARNVSAYYADPAVAAQVAAYYAPDFELFGRVRAEPFAAELATGTLRGLQAE